MVKALCLGMLFVLLYGCEQSSVLPPVGPDKDILNIDIASELKGELDPFEVITETEYVDVIEVDLLDNEDLVLVYKTDAGQYYIYPHRSLLIEVVNEDIDGRSFAINFCPLTGTGMAWNRVFDGDTTILAASGMLYRDNLVVWDSISGNLWSQMKLSTFTEDIIAPIETFPIVQMDWGIAKKQFRGAKVFIHACDSICSQRDFEPHNSDFSAYEDAELVYGIISPFNRIETYVPSDFGDEFTLQYPKLPGAGVLVAGSLDKNMIVAFETYEYFEAIEGAFPLIMKDKSGSEWDIFGQALTGPRKGERLKAARAYYAYARAWEAVWND